jgi:antibiotic biosynthesis monooxygenase (ABM) superfamily enzyme
LAAVIDPFLAVFHCSAMTTTVTVFAVLIFYYLIMGLLHRRWLANQKKKADSLKAEGKTPANRS